MCSPRRVNALGSRHHRRATTPPATNTDVLPPGVLVRSDAAGRFRITVSWLRGSPARAVAVEDAVGRLPQVRAVHAYPRTGSVVVWLAAHCPRDTVLDAVGTAAELPADAPPPRTPWSADVSGADLARMAVGGVALLVLGGRRYVARRDRLLGGTGRTVATGVTVFTGYPFLRGAARAVAGRRAPGTDALVSAATVASLVLRENVVALTVLWLLNIGEYLQ